MSTPVPVVQDGLKYWAEIPASVDGVLGGFGTGSLPRVDALGSRNFLLRLKPHLATVPSALRRIDPPKYTRRIRALDVGAGVGRVTSNVLLPLVQDVVLLEPTPSFISEAIRLSASWRGIPDASKSVTFIQGTLQDFDPRLPLPHPPSSDSPSSALGNLGRFGYQLPSNPSPSSSPSEEEGYDIIWCQWCLGHLSDVELIPFFKACKAALRPPIIPEGGDESEGDRMKSLIIVKENTCFNEEDGGPAVVFDPEDSSVTRSDEAWHVAFKEAGLTLLKQETQLGLPKGLYTVITYALR